MARYFKIAEIDDISFVDVTGDDLIYSQLVVPVSGEVFVAVDDNYEYELNVPLDCFDYE